VKEEDQENAELSGDPEWEVQSSSMKSNKTKTHQEFKKIQIFLFFLPLLPLFPLRPLSLACGSSSGGGPCVLFATAPACAVRACLCKSAVCLLQRALLLFVGAGPFCPFSSFSPFSSLRSLCGRSSGGGPCVLFATAPACAVRACLCLCAVCLLYNALLLFVGAGPHSLPFPPSPPSAPTEQSWAFCALCKAPACVVRACFCVCAVCLLQRPIYFLWALAPVLSLLSFSP
jgi:hypothetical protein